MSTSSPLLITSTPLTERQYQADSATVFGFWAYLMTDLVLFASLFAVYAVLRMNTAGGLAPAALFNGPFVLTETLILLTSSFTCGLSFLAARREKLGAVLGLLGVTVLLGIAFLSMELSEFGKLIAEGAGPSRSASLSSYFTLVGTHGLHITIGIIWCVALMIAFVRSGLTRSNKRKLILFSLFWHFLDLIWIFIFSIVYLFSIL
jgi:cytochrome o ubiquinol oxidase subunit 3